MNKTNTLGLIILGALLALGMAILGFFVSQTLSNAKTAANTAQAKGLSERRVKADLAVWSTSFALATRTRSDVARLYEKAELQQQQIIDELIDAGFTQAEIKKGTIDYTYNEYRNEEQIVVEQIHKLFGTITVETTSVDKVDTARMALNPLITKGINLSNNAPKYYFTKLNDIKPEMLKEATQNARIAANEFASVAGIKVGGIQSAVQGGFTIRDVGEDYGDTAKREKDVRVVTTISFYLTE